MNRTRLTDASNNTLGYIDTDQSGKRTLRACSFLIKGYYDPKTNITSDASFRKIGDGNLLSILLK
jgi:hypothetical protein